MADKEQEDVDILDSEAFNLVYKLYCPIENIYEETDMQSKSMMIDQVHEGLHGLITKWCTGSVFRKTLDGSECEDPNNNSFKKQEGETESGYLVIKKIMANVPNSIDELNARVLWLKSQGKKIEVLEARIYYSMRENDEGIEFKNDAKKSFLDWLIACKEFNNWEALEEIKNRVIKTGISISRFFVHLMFLMSETEEVMKKFQMLKDSLLWMIHGEKSIVIRRIVNVFDGVDIALRSPKNKKFKKEKFEGRATLNNGFFSETKVDDLILKLLKETFRLELVWTHRGLPHGMHVIDHKFTVLEADIGNCEAEVDAIEVELEKGKAFELHVLKDLISEFCTKNGGLKIEESPQYKGVKIKEVWDNLVELEAIGHNPNEVVVQKYYERE